MAINRRALLWIIVIFTVMMIRYTKRPVADMPDLSLPSPRPGITLEPTDTVQTTPNEFTFYIDADKPLMLIYTFPVTGRYIINLTITVEKKYPLTDDTMKYGFMYLALTKLDGRFMIYPFRHQQLNYGNLTVKNHRQGEQIYIGYTTFQSLQDYFYNADQRVIIKATNSRPRHILHCMVEIASLMLKNS